jgi:hypothetical protein
MTGKNPAHLSIDQKKRAVKTRPFGREAWILIYKYLIWKGFVVEMRQIKPRPD